MPYMSSDDRELDGLRGQIDRLDLELLNVLMERMKVVDRIGEYKRKNKLDISDEEREKEVLRGVVERGRSRGLSDLNVLMERMKVVDRIGEYKRKNKLDISDEEREKEVLRGVVERGRSRGL